MKHLFYINCRSNWCVRFFYMVLRSAWITQLFRKRRHVLFVSEYPVMDLKYLATLHHLLRQDSRITLALSNARRSQESKKNREVAARLGIAYWGYYRARTHKWDLVIFFCHRGAGDFSPYIPKLQAYHSLTGGKVFGGENHRFGISRTVYKNKPLYDLMFVPSERMKRRALAYNPHLKGRLAVVGDPHVDGLIQANANREKIREELGFKKKDKVVLIQSTFSEHSLLESMGAEILEIAGSLLSEYSFVLSTHPHHWSGPYFIPAIHELIIRQKLVGITVMEPGDSWERYAIASDVCLSDYTGLVCNYALLKKPLAMIEMAEGLLVEGAEELIVYGAVPHLKSAEKLPELLNDLSEGTSRAKLDAVISQIVSSPGEAHKLMKEQLDDLLALGSSETKPCRES